MTTKKTQKNIRIYNNTIDMTKGLIDGYVKGSSWGIFGGIKIMFSGYGDYLYPSKNSIIVPEGTKLKVPEVIRPIDNRTYYLEFYYNNMLINKVGIIPGNERVGYLGLYLDSDTININRNEEELIELTRDTVVLFHFTRNAPNAEHKITFECDNVTFLYSGSNNNNKQYCGDTYFYYDAASLGRIQWDTQNNTLHMIDITSYDENQNIVINRIEVEPGYRLKGLSISESEGTKVPVNNSNSSYIIHSNTEKISPILEERTGYPYYGFDGLYPSSYYLTEFAGEPGYSIIVDIAQRYGINVNRSYNVFWGDNNSIMYVEGLDKNGTLKDARVYYYAYYGEWNSGMGSMLYFYFIVDITEAPGYQYIPYGDHKITVSNERAFETFISDNIENGNWQYGTFNNTPSANFYNSASRDLYETNNSLYLEKLSTYETLYDSAIIVEGVSKRVLI